MSVQSSLRAQIQNRRVHNVPTLSYGKNYSEDGIHDFLSPEGYDMAWTQYQGFLVHKLNMLTNGALQFIIPSFSNPWKDA